MLVYIRRYLCGNLLLLFHILFFQIIKSFILLIHSHEFLFRTFLLQILTMSIVYFLASYINFENSFAPNIRIALANGLSKIYGPYPFWISCTKPPSITSSRKNDSLTKYADTRSVMAWYPH